MDSLSGSGRIVNRPTVYDKAKYRRESVELAGLDEVQAEVHTAFFLGWLLDNDLMSSEFVGQCPDLVAQYTAGDKTALDIYSSWDCCLIDDMLSEEGNAFAMFYFDFTNGQYMNDYNDLLVVDLPSEFYVEFNSENYQLMSLQIDRRFKDWKTSQNER